MENGSFSTASSCDERVQELLAPEPSSSAQIFRYPQELLENAFCTDETKTKPFDRSDRKNL